jgi:phosphoribosylformimino-5-aminoimidazole carboxamide ribonucleotide (ProFAR) isomerase
MAHGKRRIVVAVDFEEKDDQSIAFVLGSLWKQGTVIDLVHVVKAMEERNEVYTGALRCHRAPTC